jgi:NADP-dependent 3-hydroxy acid dehydrogenase YdfG
MTGIQGKVVAITGASSGIGEATAMLLAERGARVVLGARRVDRLEALAGRIAGAGGDAGGAGGAGAGGAVAFMRVDVRRRDDVAGLTAMACERFGRLDVLISNAGVGLNSPLDDLRVADWEEMLDSNVKGVLYGIAAALPLFRAQGSGHFVNTLSTSGLRIVPNQVVYAASKNAARAISEGLRQEAGESIRVTTVSPGFIGTDFAAGTVDPDVCADLLARRDKIAIPADAVARAIAFAIEQPADVDVNEIVIRPTAQT